MFVSHEHKFMFVGVPRTGSTSMYSAFREALPKAWYHGKHEAWVDNQTKDYEIVAFVRDPYEREVSHYLYRRGKKGNLVYPLREELEFRSVRRVDYRSQYQASKG